MQRVTCYNMRWQNRIQKYRTRPGRVFFYAFPGLPGETPDGYFIQFAKDFTRFLCRLHKNRENIMCIVTKLKFTLETCYKMV